MIIRDAKKSDIAELDEVLKVISNGICEKSKAEKLIDKIDVDPDKRMIVAEDRETGELLGTLYALAFEDICKPGRPILLVENVAVKENAQGKGVGRKLFEEIEAWGKSKKCHYEILVSALSRKGAHSFYKALEFEEVKGFKKFF